MSEEEKDRDTFVIGTPDQRWFFRRLAPFSPERRRAEFVGDFEKAWEFLSSEMAFGNLKYIEEYVASFRFLGEEAIRDEPAFPLIVLRVKREFRLVPELPKEVLACPPPT